ncbi:hypothetical protein ZIOFF_040083 [Zingiber officinale]|uniref:Uncharacterized protein n=1 Tax=Zingiber officinale TaxID=94328 RepID=A0A8J5G2C5_ZINOF|nr:hypothetical protein ZIOFF_040083 [Zingiber officinale]
MELVYCIEGEEYEGAEEEQFLLPRHARRMRLRDRVIKLAESSTGTPSASGLLRHLGELVQGIRTTRRGSSDVYIYWAPLWAGIRPFKLRHPVFLVSAVSGSLRNLRLALSFSSIAELIAFGTVKIATLDKHGEEHIVPIVAVDKPRLPPELGPLIVLSFLEMSSSNDKDD